MMQIESSGCSHYKRKIKFVTPCCSKLYTCRFCHDESEDHRLDRKLVNQIMCTTCCTRQKIQAICEECNTKFGKYVCLECNHFDNEDKEQFHCKGCGICRVGGRNNFFHCNTCNMCLPLKLQNKHKCVLDVSVYKCPICHEDLHTSRIPCIISDCGHFVHRTCYSAESGIYDCITCNTPLPSQVIEKEESELIVPIPSCTKDPSVEESDKNVLYLNEEKKMNYILQQIRSLKKIMNIKKDVDYTVVLGSKLDRAIKELTNIRNGLTNDLQDVTGGLNDIAIEEDTDYMCPACDNTIEIFNNDLEFSIANHNQRSCISHWEL